MRIVLRGILLLAAAAAASVTAAKADTIWTLDDVTFDDGGLVLNGTFAVNTYGYLTQSSIVLTTTGGSHSNGTGGPLPGDTYNATLVAGLINNVGGTGLPDDTSNLLLVHGRVRGQHNSRVRGHSVGAHLEQSDRDRRLLVRVRGLYVPEPHGDPLCDGRLRGGRRAGARDMGDDGRRFRRTWHCGLAQTSRRAHGRRLTRTRAPSGQIASMRRPRLQPDRRHLGRAPRRNGAPNNSTRKRMRLSALGASGSRPALASRWRTKSRGSGSCRQTLGRNRARRRPAPRMRPSRSGSSAPTTPPRCRRESAADAKGSRRRVEPGEFASRGGENADRRTRLHRVGDHVFDEACAAARASRCSRAVARPRSA